MTPEETEQVKEARRLQAEHHQPQIKQAVDRAIAQAREAMALQASSFESAIGNAMSAAVKTGVEIGDRNAVALINVANQRDQARRELDEVKAELSGEVEKAKAEVAKTKAEVERLKGVVAEMGKAEKDNEPDGEAEPYQTPTH